MAGGWHRQYRSWYCRGGGTMREVEVQWRTLRHEHSIVGMPAGSVFAADGQVPFWVKAGGSEPTLLSASGLCPVCGHEVRQVFKAWLVLYRADGSRYRGEQLV